MKLDDIKKDINWIVDRYHVSTPDKTIEEDLRHRIEKSDEFRSRTIDAAIRYALIRHHRNISRYIDIMKGRF